MRLMRWSAAATVAAVLVVAVAGGPARAADAPAAVPGYDPQVPAAHNPCFDDAGLWGRYDVKRTACYGEKWPRARRLLVWRRPGTSAGDRQARPARQERAVLMPSGPARRRAKRTGPPTPRSVGGGV